ncbi:peptide-methionine (S)-S-oxide reductase MsrA [Undibacterium sp. Ji22W]|uniref:peptide-methionine (S)-S-oxide reductase MsrA n=1 Tax=Undibacterium sp. Ji22W TaxID=3413038 RepID=UPI003BF294CF
MALETATVGGGRFWDLAAVFQHLRGVRAVTCGYAGGHSDNPSYETVCSGDTGHAEVVRVEFDNEVLSFESLLEVFFKVHDPYAPASVGGQLASPLRSVIFFHTQEQRQLAQEISKRIGRVNKFVIMTEILACTPFFAAESAHQNFYKNHKDDTYCQEFILPKIMRSRELFKRRLAA